MALLSQLHDGGFIAFKSDVYRSTLGGFQESDEQALKSSFDDLVRDRFMGDGGTYRYRRFSRFTLSLVEGQASLSPRDGNSICQALEDNRLNGGRIREFEPLRSLVAENTLLRSIMEQDASLALEYEPEFGRRETIVGVHQIRTLAELDQVGLPTPEGIHRDAERLTFQHFVGRHNASGGAFFAYDQQKRPIYSWQQEDFLDSVLFTGTTWHSADPLVLESGKRHGHRDVFLIDFDFA